MECSDLISISHSFADWKHMFMYQDVLRVAMGIESFQTRSTNKTFYDVKETTSILFLFARPTCWPRRLKGVTYIFWFMGANMEFLSLKWGCASQSTNAESGWPAHPPLLWPRGLLYFTINEVWRYFWFFGPYRPVQGPKCLILQNLWFWRGLTFCLIALAFVDQSFWKFQGFQSIYWAIERAFKDF